MTTTENLDKVRTVVKVLEAAGFDVDVTVDGEYIELEAWGDGRDITTAGIGGGAEKNGT